MDLSGEIVNQIELHSVQGIRDCFLQGVDPNGFFRGKPLIYELLSEYARGPRFKECVRAFVDFGLKMEDPVLLATLCDDATALENCLRDVPAAVHNKYTFKCAYTPMQQATLLHICAEFNHVACAAVLIKHGADVNAPAGVDENGFGGQTPIFHTVNQNRNQSFEMMNFLLSHNAGTTMTLPGLIWGKGYEWETLVPGVNPVNYAMMGLLPQMHRDERTISSIVSLLLRHTFQIDYTAPNVPCAYLKK